MVFGKCEFRHTPWEAKKFNIYIVHQMAKNH